ncbi:MAG: SIMPL domain-containing protein [Pseudomonadota bacterium]
MRAWLLLLVLTLAGPTSAQHADDRLLTVTATGVVEAMPDMATIQLGVLTEERTAQAAISTNSRAMNGILATLTAAGIEARDLQTSNFSVSPRWGRYSQQGDRAEITGYQVSNQLTVRVRELEKLGEILDVVAQAGGNLFQGLRFGVEDDASLRDTARERAVAEARRKAELLAEAADVSLGALVSLSEATGASPRPMAQMDFARAESAAVPVAAGEVGITAQVSLVYRIED